MSRSKRKAHRGNDATPQPLKRPRRAPAWHQTPTSASASATYSRAQAPGPGPAKDRARHPRDPAVRHALLARYYPYVQTLRAHLLSRLPASSRLRRKKLAAVGRNPGDRPVERLLCRLLDSTLVGLGKEAVARTSSAAEASETSGRELRNYRTKKAADDSHVTVSKAQEGACSPQSEIVDYAIWSLFNQASKYPGERPSWANDPQNVLCHGFQRGSGPRSLSAQAGVRENDLASTLTHTWSIPGLFATKLPQQAQALKEAPWPQLLALLGASGHEIMIDLLTTCSLFIPVDVGYGNYIQITGKALFDCTMLASAKPGEPLKQTGVEPQLESSLSDIKFVKNRMFYARPSISISGNVHFGLKHIHVLNRLPYKQSQIGDLSALNRTTTIHIAMYMFPRQFGLHNVFTSKTDYNKTAQKLQDYTLREDEIAAKFPAKNRSGPLKVPVPRRLRGKLLSLVEKMRILHRRCSYYELLQRYCPENKAESAVLVELAVPVARVSAFCQAIFAHVVPTDFWGSGETQAHNMATFMKKIDLWVRLRRYETLSMHETMQGMKISEIEWLAPPGLELHRLSQTDLQKRTEIFAEFMYYMFDSFLIPLIRSNFYVTEANGHRNKLFFFRHDVWRRISEPSLAQLKEEMYVEVKNREALRVLQHRELGYGQVRLLPKQSTMRPIMNLRRRSVRKGSTMLAKSTNTILAPIHAMLNYETKQRPGLLGSTLPSVRALYPQLKQFKQQMSGPGKQRLFFAKVDVKSAFDTIPQAAIVKLLGEIASKELYYMDKHVQISSAQVQVRGGKSVMMSTDSLLPTRWWRTIATASDELSGFHRAVKADYATTRRNTVFVDTAYRKMYDAASLQSLASMHILQNLVKIGKKYYLQKAGIPQGSVLSSMLCNCFYADLEAKELSFLKNGDGDGIEGGSDCLLLRLIDDFLLITTDQSKAARFVEVMHRGLPRYGVAVNPDKSLVNFDLRIQGREVERLPEDAFFPYCGMAIHCSTLNITRDWESKKPVIFNTLTVEHSRSPGYTFTKKVLGFFKILSHATFFDTSHNSLRTTLRNLHRAFSETALKMWAYSRCLPKCNRPSGKLMIDTIRELISSAYAILDGKTRHLRHANYQFSATRSQLRWLVLHAFLGVLKKKQTHYAEVLTWLRSEMHALQSRRDLRLPRAYML